MSEKESQSAEEFAESGGEDNMKAYNPGTNIFNSVSLMAPAMRRQILHAMIKTLPPSSQKCVKALKNIQLEQVKLEVKFYEEVYELQKKYQKLYVPLNEKRRDIVNGVYTPTETESEWKSDDEDDSAETLKPYQSELNKMQAEIKKEYESGAEIKGIPCFWLQVFRNTEIINDMIQEHDVEVLKKLIDVKLVYQEDDPMSYIIEFHFAANEYFTNSVLTKQYFMRTTLSQEEPLLFEGPEIYKCTGCDINWNKGMNLTVKTIKKKQKHKARNAVRTITKQVPMESFFHFFNPPEVPEELSKVDVETESILTSDFEIGHMFRERIIPKAVLYYTGDIVDDEDDDLDEEEEEEQEEEEEDEEDDEGHGGKPKSNKKVPANPAECPQQ